MGDRNLLIQGITEQNERGVHEKEDINAAQQETGFSQVEDKVMKTAAQFFGKDLLSFMSVKGEIDRVAPTEYVHLDMRRLEDDFNFIMKDGSWRHLEFESDSITERDLRRFREYEAYISLVHNVPVVTTVLCSSNVKVLKRELVNGDSTYRVQIIRLKDRDAVKVIEKLERKIQRGKRPKRRDVFLLLLTPMMSGKMEIGERICRSMDILQREGLDIKKEDVKRMQSVLYALAVKFLKRDELERVKERIGMTILGQMLFEDGVQEGMQKGMQKGIQALILDNLEEGTAKEKIIEKVSRRFSLGKEDAAAFYQKFAPGNLK